jgi:hypothetical protein
MSMHFRATAMIAAAVGVLSAVRGRRRRGHRMRRREFITLARADEVIE